MHVIYINSVSSMNYLFFNFVKDVSQGYQHEDALSTRIKEELSMFLMNITLNNLPQEVTEVIELELSEGTYLELFGFEETLPIAIEMILGEVHPVVLDFYTNIISTVKSTDF